MNSLSENSIPIAIAGGVIASIYYLFGVPRVSDRVNLIYKKDSELARRILANTELGNLTFKTCLAGTINTVQMITMLFVELVYHKLYKQVKFHREIFKFKDGG
jgi:phage-related holin